MDKIISVIIVDDHPLVLNGLQFILRNTKTIDLKGCFISATDALAFLEIEKVSVVLMDINMPEMNGIDATLEIKKKYPQTHVVAISNLNEASVADRMLQSGASGYLLKNIAANELIQAIKDVDNDQKIVSKEMQAAMEHRKTEIPVVTPREKEVLAHLAEGKTTPEIADLLFISKLTVETHRRNLLQKFNVSNAASLIHKAAEMKFI
ncbi:response regulator transcription factor [Sphingobacterium deserti]|uniref:Two component transcriptional regulator, LuxR family n=1 Tax=Sphingobacterium deserti TaxID=1229276 RepID=A0A0B8T3P8_9SPHI|nr:response regulator transcription factor [Sphingobacterium deserti]KGE16197.1 two component transcriptional regulator, LuxR family [Sphingobacterium deserti]